MNTYASAPLPPGLPFLRPFAYLNGTAMSYGGNTVAGAIAYIDRTFGPAMPIAVDAEMAGFNTHETYMRLLADVRTACGVTRNLLGSIIEPADRDVVLRDRSAYAQRARDVARYASWMKPGCYFLGPETFDRDMAFQSLAIAACRNTGKSVMPEVAERWLAWRDDAGEAHYDFRDPMPSGTLWTVARAVRAAKVSGCVVFNPSEMSALFNAV